MSKYIVPLILIFLLQFSCIESETSINRNNPGKEKNPAKSPLPTGKEKNKKLEKMDPEKMETLKELNSAVGKNNVEEAKRLLDKNPDLINMTDKSGRAPIHIIMLEGNGAVELVEMLVSKGADVNLRDRTDQKWSPLHWGADNIVLVKYLVSKGADVTLKDTTGRTPLHIEAYRGNVVNAEFFIEQGCDINESDCLWEHTPLHYAIKAKYIDEGGEYEKTVETLIEKGADLDAKDRNGDTPLKMAEKFGQKKLVKILKKHGARK
ncbi:MAG: ankyrin repeat domain-containing protein [Candidatus Eremiobacteraeota bacterium]|nr:ankyrin repeat domain-containing protein [Candidatus Eremiobacteraeota bacterium]